MNSEPPKIFVVHDDPHFREAVEQLRREIDQDVLLADRLASNDYTRAIILARSGEGYNQSTVAGEAEKIISSYTGPERIYLLGARSSERKQTGPSRGM